MGYEQDDQELPFDNDDYAEVKVINSRTYLCVQQACDGTHHYYKNLETFV